VNDNFGHLTGDNVLREVTKRMQAEVRPYDAVGRYGGEEFLILLPGCNRAETEDKAERLRRTVVQLPIGTECGPLNVTLSIGGVASGDWPDDSANRVLQMADSALYRAKKEGRNRTAMAGAADHDKAHRPSLDLTTELTTGLATELTPDLTTELATEHVTDLATLSPQEK
jgi:diguanylate cyclase (GGDEF)-like protein